MQLARSDLEAQRSSSVETSGVRDQKESKGIYKLTTPNIVFSWIFYILSTITPLILIVIGSINLKKCPIKSQIPKWMIVMGTAGLLYVSSKFSYDFLDKVKYRTIAMTLFVYLKIVELFSLSWLIVGSIWVYSIYPDVSYNRLSRNYCDPRVYQISFWHITITFIILGIVLIFTLLGGANLCWRRDEVSQK